MLDALITSKTRIRLLVKFFLNPTMKAYLRQLADEFGESTNSVRVELNRLTEAGILESEAEGNVINYKAKESHPLFPEIRSIVSKMTGLDSIIEWVIQRLGDVENAYLIGDYARGKDSGIIDVLLVGTVDQSYLPAFLAKIGSASCRG
ncbi:MAG: winged helix-turn-helix domain-containing protein, partial [Bacteroidota bacterium]